MGEGGEGTNFQLKINKLWGYNVQCDDYGQQYYTIYLKVANRVNLKNSHHKKGKRHHNYVKWWMLTKHCGDHFTIYIYFKSICCIPQTYTFLLSQLYLNKTLRKKDIYLAGKLTFLKNDGNMCKTFKNMNILN